MVRDRNGEDAPEMHMRINLMARYRWPALATDG